MSNFIYGQLSFKDWLQTDRAESKRKELRDWIDDMPEFVAPSDICVFDEEEWIHDKLERAYQSEIGDAHDRAIDEARDSRWDN